MIRKFLDQRHDLKTEELMTKLLSPTRIYHEILSLTKILSNQTIHAIAHITGGGISSNLGRIIPKHLEAKIDFKAIQTPNWMQKFLGNFTSNIMELESVFNLGCGAIIALDKKDKEEFETISKELKLSAYSIGEVY